MEGWGRERAADNTEQGTKKREGKKQDRKILYTNIGQMSGRERWGLPGTGQPCGEGREKTYK